ncbi:MAG: cytosine permease [Verrucomicrobiota bacterium]
MSNPSPLPSYIAGATPSPQANRAPWYKNIAPTYAGIFLWFVFWQDAVNAPNQGGLLSCGLGWALLSLIIAALVCYFLFYIVPGMLGMKTGLPLYLVGTSLFGATGGFILPGFLMGVLQFGWLGVNIYFSSILLGEFFGLEAASLGVKLIMVVWGVLAAIVGLKGIQYVAKVATYLPLIPLVILLLLLGKTIGGIGTFDPQAFIASSKEIAPTAPAALGGFSVLAFMLTYVVGFFATAGAAGVDIASSGRDKGDVSKGGMVGIALATIFTAGISILIVAGTHGSKDLRETVNNNTNAAIVKAVDKEIAGAKEAATTSGENLTTEDIKKLTDKVTADTAQKERLRTTSLLSAIMGKQAGLIMFLLAISAFPSACFSSFIAANSFKTTLSGVPPFISVGIGAAVSILLAVTGMAGKAIIVFQIIGASFGPILGAMLVEYLLNGGKWSGPRAGFNPAGWISWAVGFVVGILPILHEKVSLQFPDVPAAPVAAFIVGAVVYGILAKLGLQSALVRPLPAQLANTIK